MSKNKKELTHEVKLSLMRDCEIYRKPFKEEQVYFKSKGYSLSQAQSTRLKQELHSPERIRNWFSKEALYVIEEDHMLSVERIRSLEDKLLELFYTIYSKTKKSIQEIHLLIKLTAEFRSLQETKSKMFSATPLVQELMEVHRRQEENEKLYNYADRKLAS